MKCPNCGSTEDIIERLEYVGGQGIVPIIQCRDSVACWKRWDKQHDFNIGEGLSARERLALPRKGA
jgi:hypothetical protein